MPASMFKARLLIYLGHAESERDTWPSASAAACACKRCVGSTTFRRPRISLLSSALGVGLVLSNPPSLVLHRLSAQAVVIGVLTGHVDTAIDSTHLRANANRFGVKIGYCPQKRESLRAYSDPDAHQQQIYPIISLNP